MTLLFKPLELFNSKHWSSKTTYHFFLTPLCAHCLLRCWKIHKKETLFFAAIKISQNDMYIIYIIYLLSIFCRFSLHIFSRITYMTMTPMQSDMLFSPNTESTNSIQNLICISLKTELKRILLEKHLHHW